MKRLTTRLTAVCLLLLLPSFASAQSETSKPSPPGYPVYGPLRDTLFLIYNKAGAFSAEERAGRISQKINQLYNDDFLQADSILVLSDDGYADIAYKDLIIMTVSKPDTRIDGRERTTEALAGEQAEIIRHAILAAKAENSLTKILIRLGLTLLIVAGAGVVIWFIPFCFRHLKEYILKKKRNKLHDLQYRSYTFLSIQQQLQILFFFLNVFKWLVIVLAVYIILPLIFSIFPFTRDWADYLFGLVWAPFRTLLLSLWHYLPNLVAMLVIIFIFRYLLRFIRYLFSEIASERLKINGFYPDWAMPTFQLVRIFLMACALVMIFPYLPGKNSPAFQGISIFVGVLVSFGSSSAIANAVAGLVITYMRPFKLGDRIKINDVTGDVIEKTILVTRLKTIKNEEITIPNLTILQGNTVNYSVFSKNEGLIIHTTVTMGYENPWQDVHRALIDAAQMTEHILPTPAPFVLQSSLDDFYVTYQINAYTAEANRQAVIYSHLHQNIQDVFNARGLEGVSPHYRSGRDGNAKTFPPQYMVPDLLPDDKE
jgi:small-conductance mechanosensitive channel